MPKTKQKPVVVGIGASAGGIEPLQELLKALPVNLGVSYVVIMHLSPERESQLAQVLQFKTTMPVTQVTGRVDLEPNHIYVIPPNQKLEMTDSHVAVGDFDQPRFKRVPIDQFFRSLAAAPCDSVAIVLSGEGSDGAVGVRLVKEAGGLVIVQDPSEAESESMPRAAIATGLADLILPVREIATTLSDLYSDKAVALPESIEQLGDDEAQTVQNVLQRLHVRTGHDFSGYKTTTLMRCLQRRLQVKRKSSLQDYLRYMEEDDEEVQALFREMLIGVTTFFRDHDSFDALQEKVIPKLFEGKTNGDKIRVWVVGCSTGEEAYSLAIMLDEAREKSGSRVELQVFASDLDERALATAREGRYPASIAVDVSERRLQRYFVEEDHSYLIKREIRDMVLFSQHSILRDPPFSHLDLISCRNLLIYLQREQQHRVFGIFHYALKPMGYLFIGGAETADVADGIYRHIDKKHRIYQARERTGESPRLPDLLLKSDHLPGERRLIRRSKDDQGEMVAHRKMLEEYAPPSVLVDEGYRVVHFSERAGRYLQHPGGIPSNDITKLVRPELAMELRSALYRSFEKDESTVARANWVKFDEKSRRVYLTVCPNRRVEEEERLALVIFSEEEGEPQVAVPSHDGHKAFNPIVQQLEEELVKTRDRLQATLEEYESSREELKAQNEELRSINEEYKSATEELETSKEELQSMNEELQTVNGELKAKLDELLRSHGDLNNLMQVADVGTLFLERDLRIKLFTPKTTELFNLMPADRGRPISHLTNMLDYPDLEDDCRRVLKTLIPIEREAQGVDGKWFLVRIRPYRTLEDRIDGVVMTLVDVTQLKKTELQLRSSIEYSEMIIDTIREGLVVMDPEFNIKSVNESFYQMFHVKPEETQGRKIFELGNGQWDIPQLRECLEDILPQEKIINDFEVEHDFDDIGRRYMLLNARQLDDHQMILLAIDDITERYRSQRERTELKQLAETLELRVQERTAQVRKLASNLTLAEQEERRRVSQILHDDLQQRLYGIQMKLSFCKRALTGRDYTKLERDVDEVMEWIVTAIQTTRRLTVDLSPPVLKNEGLNVTLEWLATQMKDLHDLEIELNAPDSYDIHDEDTRVLLFQLIRELLFNIVKHADTKKAWVDIESADKHLVIVVRDEGKGFDLGQAESQAEQKGAFGLFSVRERLNLLGGKMEIDSAPGKGSKVTMHLPVDSKTESD